MGPGYFYVNYSRPIEVGSLDEFIIPPGVPHAYGPDRINGMYSMGNIKLKNPEIIFFMFLGRQTREFLWL